jgi:hypothetical protein
MTTKNIDDLSAAGALAGTDKAMLAQGDAQLRRTTLTAIRDWLAGTLAAVAGSGSAADLSSGTLADARLSANVARRDEANAFGDNAISRFCAVTSVQTDDYTLQASDNGSVVYVDKATAATVTLPNSLPPGFNCSVVQEGAGQLTFTAGSGATRQSPNGAGKSAVRYGVVALLVKANSGGSAADWRLAGDLSA